MINSGRLVVSTVDTKDLRLEEDAGMAYPKSVYVDRVLQDPSIAGEVRTIYESEAYVVGLAVAVETSPGVLEWKLATFPATDDGVESDGLPYYAT